MYFTITKGLAEQGLEAVKAACIKALGGGKTAAMLVDRQHERIKGAVKDAVAVGPQKLWLSEN